MSARTVTLAAFVSGIAALALLSTTAWGQENTGGANSPNAAADGSAAAAAEDGEKIDGKVKVVEVAGRGGVPVRDERLIVSVPKTDGRVRYEFSSRGGTIRSAVMLHERYTRDKDLAPLQGVPEEKLKAGPIDLVTSWDPGFLPFRAVFRELTYQGSITRVRRQTAEGRVSEGRLEAPKSEDKLEVDRALRPGDSLEVTAPEALKGTYAITKVHPSGAASVEPQLAKGTFDKVALKITRKGDLKELFLAEPTFVRVGEAGTDGAEGLPVRYVWPDPRTDTSDVFIEKRWSVGKHPYELDLSIIIHNVGKYDLKEGFGLRVGGWQHPADHDGSMFRPPTSVYAGSCYTDDTLERYLFPQLGEEQHEERGGQPLQFAKQTTWVGLDTTYFLTAAIARSMADGQCQLEAYPRNGVIAATLWSSSIQTLRAPERTCTPGWMPPREGVTSCADAARLIGADPSSSTNKLKAAWIKAKAGADDAKLVTLNKAWDALRGRQRHIYRFNVYTGPKDVDILKAYDAGDGGNKTNLVAAMDYGMLGFIAETMHGLMKWFHSWAAHWGLAIILLTILVKSLLLPLTNKSFKNMQMMKKLQPEMTKIKEKHKGDQQAQNQEMMALYKRHGFNPLMGCFPMLLQMPIWIALYQTIGNAVELYHAPLGLWINDLSAGDPYYIMPIALGGLMLAQSALTTSTGGDGLQQKMLKYGMPLMFAVFMLFLPSGLVLYILVNTILTIVQNIVIRKRMGITA